MRNLNDIFYTLRKTGKREYTLLFGCLFFANLLITTFCMMMYSSTVQNVLPDGGDSRKQVMMIFVLALIGCAAFSIYAGGLFFRYKSRESGVFLALGISRNILKHQMKKEVLHLTLVSSGLGLVLGAPLCWIIWSVFRMILVDTPEMILIFNPQAYVVPLAFTVFILITLLFMQRHFLSQVNVLDIIQETHRAEPVRTVPHWYGWGGICMIVLGSLLGNFMPRFSVLVLHWYAPGILTSLFYLPVFVGLYWVLLFTVVGGWHHGKKRYNHMIEDGMMQFQGRQTIRNMLVITVLVAGAYFAAFYAPMMMTPGKVEITNRPMDYNFFYRADQDMISKTDIESLASEYSVKIKDYIEIPSATLAIDGEKEIETNSPMGTTYDEEYTKMLCESRFISVSAWNAITGDNLVLKLTESAATLDSYGYFNKIGLVTNPVTRKEFPVHTMEEPLQSDLLQDIRVLSDEYYEQITQGLTLDWQEVQVVFNAENDSYAFSKSLFHAIIKHSGNEATRIDGYDRIVREQDMAAGEIYFFDPGSKYYTEVPIVDPSRPGSSDFRMNWKYMPKFRALDTGDFISNFAVFLMLFVFVAVLCFAAVSVILYTRSQTLILTNIWVYEDLRKLGASNAYLRKIAKGQVKRVFFAPLFIGTLLILCFYTLLLMGNGGDGIIDASERLGFVICLMLVVAISMMFYGLYKMTIKKTWNTLKIAP